MCLAVRELCVQPGGEHAELLMFPLVAIDYPPSWGRGVERQHTLAAHTAWPPEQGVVLSTQPPEQSTSV